MGPEARADADVILRNAERIRDRIAGAGGDPARVRLVAVTKGHDTALVTAALGAGLTDLGESYVQELVSKVEGVAVPGVRWHFIGRLQRNKVRQAAGVVDLWQSVDRLVLGKEIARRAPGSRVLAQVGLDDDPARGGARPAEVPALVRALGEQGLVVEGLMAIAPRGGDARRSFAVVRALADDLGLAERSMGMSGDLEAAVAEGSTMVRVGTDLFGRRVGD